MNIKKIALTCCLVLASTFAIGQRTCSDDIVVSMQTCTGAGGCRDNYPMTIVLGCKDTSRCFEVQTLSTVCCGRTFFYSNFTGLTCPFSVAELKDSGKRTTLLALAATRNILVRDCTGAFMPLDVLLDSKQSGQHVPAAN